MAKKTKISPLAKVLIETVDDMRKAGLIDRASHKKITLRHVDGSGSPPPVTDPQTKGHA